MKMFLNLNVAVSLTLLGSADPAEKTTSVSPLRIEVPARDPTKIRFTPPAPLDPIPQIPIVSSTTTDHGSHWLTIARAEPSTLPDLPTQKAAAERSETYPLDIPEREYISIIVSAKIYDKTVSQIQWSDSRTSERFEAWCAWDWELVSSAGVLTGEGIHCSVLSLPVQIVTQRTFSGPLRQRPLPARPELAPGDFVITTGSADSILGKSFLEAYRSYLLRNRPVLEAALAARRQASAAASAWRAANPPVQKDTTIWLRPHRGSRYLNRRETQP